MSLLLCAVLAVLTTACGHEGTTGAPPLSERSSNDVPLNPPTLQFQVSPTGEVGASPELEAEAGEVVALVLENESTSDYELRMTDPEGGEVFVMTAPSGGRGDGRAMPRVVGPHVVRVYPVGDDAAAAEFVIEVSET